jgi:hypothetical protein
MWITVLALPLAALGLLLAESDLDRHWEHHRSHFWLVLTVAAVNVTLGVVASEAASRRDDARTFFVSLALLASAGFLGLHALATPGVLLDDMTAGLSVADGWDCWWPPASPRSPLSTAMRGSLVSWHGITGGYEPASGWSWPRGRSRRWPGSRC